MRLVLGLSLTASSAVWVLVDTDTGNLLAEEVVALDSPHELARAAAVSVQGFDAQTEHDIEGVRLTWCDDASQQGIRLRTKLRLFGFETVETVSQEAAREGRNKTARHLAPHLTLAYGAARAGREGDETLNVLQRLAVRVPNRVALASGAAAAAAAVGGIGLYVFGGASSSEAQDIAAAEQTPAKLIPLPPAAPPTLAAPPPVAQPAEVPAPSQTNEPAGRWPPATTVAGPESVTAGEAMPEGEPDSTVPVALPATARVPHLATAHGGASVPTQPGIPAQPPAQPAHAGIPALPGIPAQPAAQPAQPGIPAQPAALPAPPPPAPPPPAPLPPVLSSLFEVLP
ncbi:MAG: hypothetical protein ACPGVG_11015 [Mycobacterium sp.]